MLQGRAHNAGFENDPEAEEFWHISDAELFPYELTFMDCAWDGESDATGAIAVEATGQWYHHHEAVTLCKNVDAQTLPR